MECDHTLQQFAMLADIRFKLLASVPVLAGAAIAFLGQTAAPETTLAVRLLGFIETINITFYDIRFCQEPGMSARKTLHTQVQEK